MGVIQIESLQHFQSTLGINYEKMIRPSRICQLYILWYSEYHIVKFLKIVEKQEE